ncbi:hypothetical protein AM493_09140 [Flavobacterium akiainvivens]|uniref:Uncharacterized protein n=1 Tax=Flavobacterium akiainvivens TaxID=1202724 RepID=A0A0M8MHZ9_9FLAO|nr:hypothetical protein [Flavobacterium akiainvivens]KOS06177.1 hypothetical protein AM493_09140 [Flavobacterium akiainvivens]SFQ68285.1 hypothetical protein SAMN05444144_11462 [Flavobacterium akiainvivens]
MKWLLLLLLVPFSLLAQIGPNNTVSGNNVLFSGTVYLDSVAIDINKTFLDPDNIQSISFGVASQDSIQGAPKAVYISRKVPSPLTKLSTVYVKDSVHVKFLVDDSYIEKPEEYLIETSCIKSVSVLDNTKGVTHNPPSIILHITTRKEKE